MKYTHLYVDKNGASQFGEGTFELNPVDFAPPAPPIDVSNPWPAERMLPCRLPAGWFGDRHPAPARQFWIQLSGEIEVQVSSGETRRFRAGDVALVEDTFGEGHTTRVVSDVDVLAVFVQFPTDP